LSPVGDVASAVENALAAYSGTTAAPHEYFDHTGWALNLLIVQAGAGLNPFLTTSKTSAFSQLLS
jgi:hypothetical protein